MGSNARTYEEFMAEVKSADPERFALIAHRYPVLSERQMRTRSQELEIPFSQLGVKWLDYAEKQQDDHGHNEDGDIIFGMGFGALREGVVIA